ncbi:MAG: hypothetical protein AAF329_27015, partial [Cyanobacteria bacterium P01_A01_bin.17]
DNSVVISTSLRRFHAHMNSFTSRLRSRTSLAIAVYLLTGASLGLFAQAQMNALHLVHNGRPALSHH